MDWAKVMEEAEQLAKRLDELAQQIPEGTEERTFTLSSQTRIAYVARIIRLFRIEGKNGQVQTDN